MVLSGGEIWTEEFDILNNPYVEFIGLELSNGDDGMPLTPKYEFEPCASKHMANFMPEHTLVWYAQPICFKNRDDVKMEKSWWFQEFNVPAIGILYCKNTVENGNWCKPIEEIDAWLMDHAQYFVH